MYFKYFLYLIIYLNVYKYTFKHLILLNVHILSSTIYKYMIISSSSFDENIRLFFNYVTIVEI